MLHDVLSVLFLLAVAAVPPGAALIAIRRSPYTPLQSLLYFGDVLLTRLLWRTSAPPRLPLAAGQGGVLVSNHRSSVDPFFVQLSAGRVVHWMVAREYCEHPAFAWFLRACQVIPVRRTGIDTAATKTAIRLAREGGVIGMFPEGRINMTDDFLLPSRPGAAMIALHAGVPLVPCYIEGSPYDRYPWSPFFMPARVTVRFGRPIDVTAHGRLPHDDDTAEALLVQCLEEIARLAGRSDAEVRLAGRSWKPTAEELEADMAAAARRHTRSQPSA